MVVTFRWAVLTAVTTFILLVIGGLVNPTGSSLACPDWPTCYGSFFPEMTDGVEYEHTHRAVAALVGLLTVILGVLIWRFRKDDRGLVRLGGFAIALVVTQGLLGGMTVIFELPPAISMTHLALSMFFFSTLIYLTFRLWPGRKLQGSDHAPEPVCAPRGWALAAAISVYVQILLGGLVRHSSAGITCGDSVPWCKGSAWPEYWQQKVHMLHRYGGVIVTLIVIVATANVAWNALKHEKSLAFQGAVIAPFLTFIQIVLGVLTVTSWIGVVEVTAHMGIGALLLANWVIVWIAMGPQAERIYRDNSHVGTP